MRIGCCGRIGTMHATHLLEVYQCFQLSTTHTRLLQLLRTNRHSCTCAVQSLLLYLLYLPC